MRLQTAPGEPAHAGVPAAKEPTVAPRGREAKSGLEVRGDSWREEIPNPNSQPPTEIQRRRKLKTAAQLRGANVLVQITHQRGDSPGVNGPACGREKSGPA